MKCVMNIFQEAQLEFEKWSAGDHYGGSSVEMAKTWGAEKLGFHLEILDPGKFGCPYHKHHKEEELFIAVKGEATIRQDEEFFQVRSGDVFFFKTGVSHQMYNHTQEPFLFFALSSKDSDEICDYPDSNKRLEGRTRTITQNGIKVEDYWKDEEDPRKFWPKNLI